MATPHEVCDLMATWAEAKWNTVNVNAPDDALWGMFSYGDGNGAMGGGKGIHTWFATRAELLTFITDVLPYSPPGRNDSFEVASVVTSIVTNMRHGVFDDATGMQYLNTALHTSSQITWMGTFATLCTSADAHARDVRAWCRSQWADDGDDTREEALTADERADFIEVLPTYGI